MHIRSYKHAILTLHLMDKVLGRGRCQLNAHWILSSLPAEVYVEEVGVRRRFKQDEF
jgi:hypothetical protein